MRWEKFLRRWRQLYRRDAMGFGPAVCLAGAAVLLAAIARLLLGLIGPTLAFATFFPCVMVCSLIGGPLPGLLSIALSIITVWYVFIDPPFAFAPMNAVMVANFVVFTLSSLAIVWLATVHRELVFAFEDAEAERAILAREAVHRSKNQLAIVTSLIRRTVTDKADADKAIERIRVAALTEDLMAQSSTQPIDLNGLVNRVVRAAHREQVQSTGPDVPLTAEIARALGFALHEMATNALKHGALTNESGLVRIEWTRGRGLIEMSWVESGGPHVTMPDTLGFGSTLIEQVLKGVGASHQVSYDKDGCRHVVSWPDLEGDAARYTAADSSLADNAVDHT